jgi:diguanylate cyclase (GGDEF)-like protein/PAS domain S-box-containing protein
MNDSRFESCWRSWLALLICLLATGYLSYSAKTDAESLAQQRFSAESDEIRLKILSLLEAHKQVLLGGAALFNASHYVDRTEWKNYVSRLRLDDHFKGIQGIGLALWIPRDQLAPHIASIREQGFPEYSVCPAGGRAAYAPIIFIEPFEGRNLRAFGFDMYSEPVRRIAMQRARDENMAALSGKVTLMQETNQDIQAGTLMYVPIYRKSAPLQTVEQRRAALYGWVYSPFRMNDFLQEMLNDEKNLAAIHIQVFSGAVPSPDSQLFNSKKNAPYLRLPGMLERHLTFGGQEWTLLFENDSKHNLDYSKAWWLLLGGTLSGILLFFLIAAYMGMRRALQTANTATAELRRSEENFRVMAKNESVLIWMSGLDKKCNSFNQVWLEFTGRTLAQETGDGWTEGVHPDDLQNCLATYLAAFDARQEFTMEYRLRRHDGEYRWIVDHGVPRTDASGNFIGYIGSCIDITERMQIEEQLRLTQFAMDNAFIGIYWLNKDARICYVNKQACATLGYTSEELLRLSIPDIDPLNPIDQWNKHWEALKRDKSQFFETQHRRKDGTIIPVEISANYVDFGRQELNVAFCRDISERKHNEAQIHALAYFDALTKLPNRRMLSERLSLAIAASRRSGRLGALLFIDLDNFKPLNDTCGHRAGDLLLTQVAERMTNCVREIDTVARFGGDEFVVVMGELADNRDTLKLQAGIVAEKIRAALAAPYVLKLNTNEQATQSTIEHYCTSSIGITLFDGREDNQEAILLRGDIAMYHAKAAGRNQLRFYE